MPLPLLLTALCVGTTLFSTYANIRSAKEQKKQAIEDQVDRINQLKEIKNLPKTELQKCH